MILGTEDFVLFVKPSFKILSYNENNFTSEKDYESPPWSYCSLTLGLGVKVTTGKR